jgi:RNA-directed DNA polymerase
MWIKKFYRLNPFERYADDIIGHCNNKEEAENLLVEIRQRLVGFQLELHPEKTKIVYCKMSGRKDDHLENSFTFLSYSFQPRKGFNALRKRNFTTFSPALCRRAKVSIREVSEGSLIQIILTNH